MVQASNVTEFRERVQTSDIITAFVFVKSLIEYRHLFDTFAPDSTQSRFQFNNLRFRRSRHFERQKQLVRPTPDYATTEKYPSARLHTTNNEPVVGALRSSTLFPFYNTLRRYTRASNTALQTTALPLAINPPIRVPASKQKTTFEPPSILLHRKPHHPTCPTTR